MIKKILIYLLFVFYVLPCHANNVVLFLGQPPPPNPDVTAPTFQEATIDTLGTTVEIILSEPVVITLLDDGDFDLDCSVTGNNIALNSCTVSDNTITCTAASTIQELETCNLDYTGGADEVEDPTGNDLAAFSDGTPVYNQSDQGGAGGGETYYVTQNGAGDNAGGTWFWISTPTSIGEAMSLAQFNHTDNWGGTPGISWAISPGDTVYFSGTFTSTVAPPGSGTLAGGYITLDGDSSGDFDPWGGGTSNAIFTGGMFLDGGIDYITVQDFRGSGGGASSLNNIILIGSTSSADNNNNITIKRNYLYDADNLTIYAIRSSAGESTNRSTNLLIEGNKLTNFGLTQDAQCGVNIYNQDNFILRNNEIGHNEGTGAGEAESICTSANVVEVHTSQIGLIENNNIYGAPQQSGIAIKENGNTDLIVRFNWLHDNPSKASSSGSGISVGDTDTDDIYVYGNLLSDNQSHGASAYYGANDVYFWANIITGNERIGFFSTDYDGTNPPTNIRVVNNSFYRNSTDYSGSVARTDLYLHRGTGLTIKNNIFFDFRYGDTTSPFYALYETLSSNPTLDYNQYYHGGDTVSWVWDGSTVTISTLQAQSKELNISVADPSLTNPSAGTAAGFEPTSATPNGEDLSGTIDTITVQGTSYGAGVLDMGYVIDPDNTDFSTVPPTVTMMDNSTNLDRGAVGIP